MWRGVSVMDEVTNDLKEHSGEATHDKYRELEGLSLEEWAFVDARERFMATTNLTKGFILRYMRRHSGRILSDIDRVSCDWPSIEGVLLTSGFWNSTIAVSHGLMSMVYIRLKLLIFKYRVIRASSNAVLRRLMKSKKPMCSFPYCFLGSKGFGRRSFLSSNGRTAKKCRQLRSIGMPFLRMRRRSICCKSWDCDFVKRD